jgi:hypothetical protein
LLGVLLVEGDNQKTHVFWADSPAYEVHAFDAFLDILDNREDFALFHYGSYEKKLLQRMRKVVERKDLVDRALANAVNVLSEIHASVYFPMPAQVRTAGLRPRQPLFLLRLPTRQGLRPHQQGG